jgi:hypothetical protein
MTPPMAAFGARLLLPMASSCLLSEFTRTVVITSAHSTRKRCPPTRQRHRHRSNNAHSHVRSDSKSP